MKKCLLGLGVAALTALSLVSCKKVVLNNDGQIFHIYVWNEEFKGFFEKYVSDEKAQFQAAAKVEKDGDKTKAASMRPAETHYKGKKVKWTITPSDGGAYQKALDLALENNATAKEEDKIDLFLAEADYILKYNNSTLTRDVTDMGVKDFSNIYNYTKEAASSSKGEVKGVSFQCCPAGVIYRRSIAKEVLGVSEPAEVQAKLSDWSKFDDVAAQMKKKGYYMTASFAETYRAFSNNVKKPWVNSKNELQFDDQINTWMEQADKYNKNGYTLTAGIWDAECTALMYKNGDKQGRKAFCYFGPAWYYNFCMPNAQDPVDGCPGDWGLIEGPAKYFWGGTWLLAPANGSNDDLTRDVMNAFINDHDVCYNLVAEEGQFSNNQAVNAEYAKTGKGNAFLGGQNDTALYLELAKGIKFQNITIYDQYCNEGLQTYFGDYLKGTATKDEAIANFKDYIERTCTGVKAK